MAETTEEPAMIEEEWDQVGQFKVPTKGHGGFTAIAVTADDKVVVVESNNNVFVLQKSGELIHTIDAKAEDVAVTASGDGFAIPQHMSCCKLYDANSKDPVSEFKTVDADNSARQADVVTVDKDGAVIFGMKKAISIYNADGSFKSSFAIKYKPASVAVTSGKKIIVAGDGAVQVFKSYFSGKKFTTPFEAPPDAKKWDPGYMCVSKKDELFVANEGTPKAVYKFAESGKFLGCVTTDIKGARAIALSHDEQELYVVENGTQTVKIFESS